MGILIKGFDVYRGFNIFNLKMINSVPMGGPIEKERRYKYYH